MTIETSARLGLPLLQIGQAQKETTHNEALTLLDFAVQPVVEAVGINLLPAAPATGASWIVGGAPSGVWSGQARALACWTASGWRFIAARAGMTVWSLADVATARFDGAAWSIGLITGTQVMLGGKRVLTSRQGAIAAPANGTTVDTESRATIAAMLAMMRLHGLIEP